MADEDLVRREEAIFSSGAIAVTAVEVEVGADGAREDDGGGFLGAHELTEDESTIGDSLSFFVGVVGVVVLDCRRRVTGCHGNGNGLERPQAPGLRKSWMQRWGSRGLRCWSL